LAVGEPRRAINSSILGALGLILILLNLKRARALRRGEVPGIPTPEQLQRHLRIAAVVLVILAVGVSRLALVRPSGRISGFLLAAVVLLLAMGSAFTAVAIPKRFQRPEVQERFRRLAEDRRRPRHD
jgi:hypothetical protein